MTIGRKDDSEKLRYDLMPVEVEEEIVKVLIYGAKKYAENNWKYVERFEDRYYAALRRHIAAWRKGKKLTLKVGCII